MRPFVFFVLATLLLVLFSFPTATVATITTVDTTNSFSSTSTQLEKNEIYTQTYIEQLWHKTMGNKKYVLNKYDCTQFTLDFADILAKHNFTAQPVAGFYLDKKLTYGKTLHCWLIVEEKPFEATAGMFIPQNYYKEHYIMKKKKCW